MAKLHCITMDTVQAAMPFPKLMCCHDEPTYPKMAIIQNEIYQKFAMISLPYGNGHLRFLGIIMPEALYAQHFNDSFQLPHDPGKYPNDIPTNSSAQ